MKSYEGEYDAEYYGQETAAPAKPTIHKKPEPEVADEED